MIFIERLRVVSKKTNPRINKENNKIIRKINQNIENIPTRITME